MESPLLTLKVVLVVGALLADLFWQSGLNVALFISNAYLVLTASF